MAPMKPDRRLSVNISFCFRHKLYYATLALKPGSRAVITDVCVPISRLPDILLETRKDIDASGIIGL